MACTFVLDIAEHKYLIDRLAYVLRYNMYFSVDYSCLEKNCSDFEYALQIYKSKVYQDLIAGLNKGK
jgi:hypothetical protein